MIRQKSDIKHDVSLKALNTFAVECRARSFACIHSINELNDLLDHHSPDLILGGGSNLLFVDDVYDGLVIQPALMGIEHQEQQDNRVLVRAMAGENWHQFVTWCVKNNYGGLENLSLIPGSVGAAPVQNIGAYGVELGDFLYEVEVMNLQDGTIHRLGKEQCELSYRGSIFKTRQRGQWLILSVSFLLTTQHHQLNTAYGAIGQILQDRQIDTPTIQDIRHAVIDIRQQRLPDPAKLPNAGSFFKNPVLGEERYRQLKSSFPELPGYAQNTGEVKVPAAWLIEQCGWKGHRRARCGVHEDHALILVNHNAATGADIRQLSIDIQDSVTDRYKIQLQSEVNFI